MGKCKNRLDTDENNEHLSPLYSDIKEKEDSVVGTDSYLYTTDLGLYNIAIGSNNTASTTYVDTTVNLPFGDSEGTIHYSTLNTFNNTIQYVNKFAALSTQHLNVLRGEDLLQSDLMQNYYIGAKSAEMDIDMTNKRFIKIRITTETETYQYTKTFKENILINYNDSAGNEWDIINSNFEYKFLRVIVNFNNSVLAPIQPGSHVKLTATYQLEGNKNTLNLFL